MQDPSAAPGARLKDGLNKAPMGDGVSEQPHPIFSPQGGSANHVGLKGQLKGQLDLEKHGGQSIQGVAIRVAQRVLAMAAAIWHNNKTSQPITRSLIAYDH